MLKVSREIFGPVLPIVEVDDVEEAIEFINARYAQLSGLIKMFLTRCQ